MDAMNSRLLLLFLLSSLVFASSFSYHSFEDMRNKAVVICLYDVNEGLQGWMTCILACFSSFFFLSQYFIHVSRLILLIFKGTGKLVGFLLSLFSCPWADSPYYIKKIYSGHKNKGSCINISGEHDVGVSVYS